MCGAVTIATTSHKCIGYFCGLRKETNLIRAQLGSQCLANEELAANREALLTKIRLLYRHHYRVWAPQICHRCHPATMHDFSLDCVKLSKFRWIRRKALLPMIDGLNLRPKAIRTLHIDHIFHPFLSSHYDSMLYCADDILDGICTVHYRREVTQILENHTRSGSIMP